MHSRQHVNPALFRYVTGYFTTEMSDLRVFTECQQKANVQLPKQNYPPTATASVKTTHTQTQPYRLLASIGRLVILPVEERVIGRLAHWLGSRGDRSKRAL